MKAITKYQVDEFLRKILNILNAIYQKGENVDNNLINDDDKNRKYLGTYFLRSYNECFSILSELYSNKTIKESIQNKAFLNILDIGSGNGANLLGLLTFLLVNGLTSKNIIAYSIDGNDIAINSQKYIIDEFNKEFKTNYKVEIKHIIFENKESFKNKISNLLFNVKEKFDIVMSFKFICELINKDYKNSNDFYCVLTQLIQDYISETGVYILLDIVAGDYNNRRDYSTKILSSNINKYLKDENSKLSCIIPLCCAFWHKECTESNCYIERIFNIKNIQHSIDKSKVAYRVLAPKEFANRILENVNLKESYQMCYNEYNPKACKNGKLIKISNLSRYSSAFTF